MPAEIRREKKIEKLNQRNNKKHEYPWFSRVGWNKYSCSVINEIDNKKGNFFGIVIFICYKHFHSIAEKLWYLNFKYNFQSHFSIYYFFWARLFEAICKNFELLLKFDQELHKLIKILSRAYIYVH